MNSKELITNHRISKFEIQDPWDIEYGAKTNQINMNDVKNEMNNLGNEISDLRSAVSVLIRESLKLIYPESIDTNSKPIKPSKTSKSTQSLITTTKTKTRSTKSISKSKSITDLKSSVTQKTVATRSKTDSKKIEPIDSTSSSVNQQKISTKPKQSSESTKLDDLSKSSLNHSYNVDYLKSLRYSIHSLKKPNQLTNPKITELQNIVNSTELEYVRKYYPYSFDSMQRTWLLNCELSNDSLISKARVLLNNMKRENYESIMQKFTDLNVRTQIELDQLVDLIYNKVINELANYDLYAKLCKFAPQVFDDNKNRSRTVRLGIMMMQRCQQEFECSMQHKLTVQNRHKQEIERCNDKEKKEHLINYLEIEKSLFRMKSIGNIELMSHLYFVNPLYGIFIDSCINRLIANQDEDSIECVCVLLRIVGEKYEKNSKIYAYKFDQQMHSLKKALDHNQFDMKVKLTILEIIELHNNGWKTINKKSVQTKATTVHKIETCKNENKFKSGHSMGHSLNKLGHHLTGEKSIN